MKKSDAVFTQGPIETRMLKSACAMVAGTLAMSGYNIADTYFVGQLPGHEPLAAMGFTFPVVMLVGCLFHGLAIGIVAPTAQALGGARRKKAVTIISSGLLLVLLFSVTMGILGILFADNIFGFFGAQGDVLELVKEYMGVWFFGCATASLAMSCNNLLVSIGSSKQGSALMMTSMLINVGLDPIFIFGVGGIPGLGIKGAAIATILSQCFATTAGLLLLRFNHHLVAFKATAWRKLRVTWGIIIKYGIPACIGMLMMPLGSAVITKITASFGDVAVAATAASGRLEMVAFVFPMALGMSLMPMIGQNYGAKKYDRIRRCFKFAMGFAFVYLTFMAVLYFFFSRELVKYFSTDLEVQAIMIDCLMIIPWGFAAIEIHRYSGFFYTGSGHTKMAAYLNGIRVLGLMIPFSFIALYLNSLNGLFFARLLADVLSGALGFFLARRLVKRLPKEESDITNSAEELTAIAVAQADIDNKSSTQ